MGLIISLVTKANSLSQAAKSCCDAGDYDAGFQIALKFEPLLHEANTLINAVSTLNRLSKCS